MIQRAQPGVPRRRFLVGSLAAGTAALTARSYARVIGANESWRTSTVMGWDEARGMMAPAHTLSLSHVPEPAATP